MNNRIAAVHSLMLPIASGHILLPSAAVAEIVEYRPPSDRAGAPAWCLGDVAWRGLQIPLVSYEAYLGDAPPAEQARLRIAVLNTLNGNPDLPFIGVVLAGIPRLLTAAAGSVVTDSAREPMAGVLSQVKATDEAATIPDVDVLERSLLELEVA